MPESVTPESLAKVLRDLNRWLAASQAEGLVIGGVAAGLLGRPRTTRDVDAVVFVDPDGWESFIETGKALGFTTRVADPMLFARRNRLLLMRHTATEVDLDLSFGALPLEFDMMRESSAADFEGVSIRIPRPEYLIILKAVAHRDRDMKDIEGVVDAHPDLDHKLILRWVRDIAEVLETPEIAADIEKILARTRPPKPRTPRRRKK